MDGERRVRGWCAFLCGVLLAMPALAQFELDRLVIAGGGAQSDGGTWSLTGTIGQSDAYAVPLCSDDGALPGQCEGASFQLVGGFWAGLMPPKPLPNCVDLADCIFQDGFEVIP